MCDVCLDVLRVAVTQPKQISERLLANKMASDSGPGAVTAEMAAKYIAASLRRYGHSFGGCSEESLLERMADRTHLTLDELLDEAHACWRLATDAWTEWLRGRFALLDANHDHLVGLCEFQQALFPGIKASKAGEQAGHLELAPEQAEAVRLYKLLLEESESGEGEDDIDFTVRTFHDRSAFESPAAQQF
jgi:hypothetical protein